MSILVGRQAPDFTAAAVLANGEMKDDFKLSQFRGKKIVIFFYPLDFSFVCPSEILAHHHRISEFEKRGAQVIGVSVDSKFTHGAWRRADLKDGGLGGAVDFPLVADVDHAISDAYGVLHPASVALRASFLIDENFNVRHQVVNDLELGRNVDEMLRMIDALNFHTEHGDVCPAGWKAGDAAIPTTHEGMADYLVKNADKL